MEPQSLPLRQVGQICQVVKRPGVHGPRVAHHRQRVQTRFTVAANLDLERGAVDAVVPIHRDLSQTLGP